MSKKEPSEMSFLEHLEELRWHIIRSVLAVMVFAIIAFLFKEVLFDVIIMGPSKPDFFTNRMLCKFGEYIHSSSMCMNQTPIKLQSIEMAGQFLAHIRISMLAGLILSFPYIFYQLWQFISPALRIGEKRVARGAVLAISGLFLSGVVFGYYLICPFSVDFLVNYKVSELAENNIKLMSYISTISSIVLAGGIAFELPVLVYFLSRIGLVTPQFLRKYRKHSIVIILVVAAVITPPDVFSQILVSVPLLILYEVGIGISARVNRRMKSKLIAGAK